MLQAHLLLLKVIYNTIEETIYFFFFFITFKASPSPLEYLIFLCHGKKKKWLEKTLNFNLQILSMFLCEKEITSHFEQ